jgi:hypothetical protein
MPGVVPFLYTGPVRRGPLWQYQTWVAYEEGWPDQILWGDYPEDVNALLEWGWNQEEEKITKADWPFTTWCLPMMNGGDPLLRGKPPHERDERTGWCRVLRRILILIE